jgi:hypothetical protein
MQENIFRSTMLNGLIMGILFSVNFVFTSSKSLPLLLLSYVIIALIIVFMYRMLKRYRDTECGGYINYWRSFNYVVLTFLFAGIISTVFKIIYTKYINPDLLPALLEESMKQIENNRGIFESLNLPLDEQYYEELERQMRPVNYSIQTIWVNILFGAVLGFILSGFVKKQKSIFDEESQLDDK